MGGKSAAARGSISNAPLVWAIPLLPFWISFYLGWLATVIFRAIVYALVLALFFAPAMVSLGVAGFVLMPITASQTEFYETAQSLVDWVTSFYDEFLVEPVNQLSDCFFMINVWYNQTIAFVQAVIALVGQEFGLDIFVWALRGDVEEWRLAQVRVAALNKLRTAQLQQQWVEDDGSNLDPIAREIHKASKYEQTIERSKLVLRAHRLAKRAMGFHMKYGSSRTERIDISAILDFLCDFIGFVLGFVVSLLDIFSDFVLLLLDVLLDFITLIFGDPSAVDIVVVFILTILDTLLDLIDPWGCFHPFDEMPQRVFPCICPHAYDDYEDVPSNIFNAVAGCICPGIDLTSGNIIEDILKPCADVDILEDILSVIQSIMEWIGMMIDLIQNLYRQVVNIVDDIKDLKDDIEDIADKIEDIICSFPGVCRRTIVQVQPTQQHLERMARTEMIKGLYGMDKFLLEETRRDIAPIIELVEVLNTETGAVIYTYHRKLRSREKNAELQRQINMCYHYNNETTILLNEAFQKLSMLSDVQEALHNKKIEDAEAYELASQLYRAHQEKRKARTLSRTYESLIGIRGYLETTKRSLMGKTLLQLFSDRVRDSIMKSGDPVMKHRLRMAEAMGSKLGLDNSDEAVRLRELGKDYATVIKGVGKLGKLYLDLIRMDYSAARKTRTAKEKGYLGPVKVMEMMKERGISVVELATTTMRISDRKRSLSARVEEGQSLGRKALGAVVKKLNAARMNTALMFSPINIPDTVERIILERPDAESMVGDHLTYLEESLTAFESINDILNGYKNGTRRGDVEGRMTTRDMTTIRALLRGETIALKKDFYAHLPHVASENWELLDTSTRSVIIIGGTLIGASVALCAIQFVTLALTACLPVLIILILALAPIFFMAIPMALDAVLAAVMTFFNGGTPQGMDFVSPFIFELTPLVRDSYTEGWDISVLGDIMSVLFDLGILEIQYVVSGYLRQFLCQFPRVGFLDSCPPKPRYDPVTGAPAVSLPEYVFEIISCNPETECHTNLDCIGHADCACVDEPRDGTEEAPCGGVNDGFCRCWPYVNPRWGLQEISGSIELDPQCEELGWPRNKIAFYQSDSKWENIKQWINNSHRTLRFGLNRLFYGIYLPWIGLAGLAFNLLPVGDSFGKGIFWATLGGNVLTAISVPLSDYALDQLIPNMNGPLFVGTVATFLVNQLRFPNFDDANPKGFATTREWMCSVVQIPPAGAGTMAQLILLTPLAPLLFAGSLTWLFFFFIDIVLFPLNFIVLFSRIMIAHAWMYRRKLKFTNSVALFSSGVDPQTAMALANGSVDASSIRPVKVRAAMPIGMAYQLGHVANTDARELKRSLPGLRAEAVRGPNVVQNEERLAHLDDLERWLNYSIGAHTSSSTVGHSELFSANSLVPDVWDSLWNDPWFSMRKRKFIVSF